MAAFFEVCTAPDSPLIKAGRKKGVVVHGFGLENGYDMLLKKTKRNIMRRARAKNRRPRAMLCSPPCTKHSSLQNLVKRRKTRKRLFRKELRRIRPLYKNCYDLSEGMLRNGSHVIMEQPKRCRSWKKTELRDRKKLFKYSCAVLGCNVGLKAPDVTGLMSKTWLFKTSSEHIANVLSGLDVCRHRCKHVQCLGSYRPDFSKHYPPFLANKIVDAVKTLPVPQNRAILFKGKRGRSRLSSKVMSSTERWRKFVGKPLRKRGKVGRPRSGQKPMSSTERSAKARKKSSE